MYNKKVKQHVEEVTNTILESPYGIHSLVVYSDMATSREFWSFYLKKSIEEKDELVCLAPFYHTVDSVRKLLADVGHMSVDVTTLETDEKSLILGDSLEYYRDNNGSAFATKSQLKSIQHLVKYTNGLEKNGVSILVDMGAFLFKNQIQSILDHELNLPSRFDINLNGVCMYRQKDLIDYQKIHRKK